MRKRKRDWPITVYRYRLMRPEPAAVIFETAERQRHLWNQLVEFWESLRLLDQMYGVADFWTVFDAEAKRLLGRGGLDWVNGPDVLDRFRTALKTNGRVRFQRADGAISVSHRFTQGGLPIAEAFSGRGGRFRLEMPPSWTYTSQRSQRPHGHRPWEQHPRLTWGMRGSISRFYAILHRSLPEGAILKRAILTTENRGQGPWHLCMAVEVPPEVQPEHKSKLSCGLDLGWRVFEGYLRIGMIADSEGRLIELRLPWGISKKKLPRERKGNSYVTTESELRSLRDNARNAGDMEAVERLSVAMRWTGQHWRQRRKWFYRNLANWLCQRYARICWEGELKLTDLAREKSSLPVRLGQKYRACVATGELRAVIKQTAQRYNTEIVAGKTAYSTTTCTICGAQAKAGAARVLECGNGHRWDQDENAAWQLFSQMGDTAGQIAALRKLRESKTLEPLGIAEQLRAVTVEVQPE